MHFFYLTWPIKVQRLINYKPIAIKYKDKIFEGYRIRLRSRASYILAGIWFLMCVVLANAYGGVLFSFLSVPKLEPIVNSLEELGNAKKLQLIVQDKTEMAERLMVRTIVLLL